MENPVLELKREMHKDYYYSEAIKTLRTNLQFCGRSIKVIMKEKVIFHLHWRSPWHRLGKRHC